MANDSKKLYGFNSSELTTTMMQNSQWGAVAYLSQSEYGNIQKSNDEESGIWNNPYNEGFVESSTNSDEMDNCSTNMTGMAGTRSDNSIKRDTYTSYSAKLEGTKEDNGDTIKISYKTINSDSSEEIMYTNIYYRYYTENGQKASTTRNIYGIYDMSGGAWEYMANCLGEVTGNYYVSEFLEIDSKYQTSYACVSRESETNKNYEANKEKYGDAIWETSNGCNGQSSWNQDYSRFPYIGAPFFLRGGNYVDSAPAGLFFYNWYYGEAHNYISFRVVLF